MKLLIILLILTISIKNCLSSGFSYTLVPYEGGDCKTLSKNIGITFPLPKVGLGEYSITPVIQEFGENCCAVITSQTSYSVKFEWYYNDGCTTKPPNSTQPLETDEFSTNTCAYSSYLNGFYKLTPTMQIQFPSDALKIQISTKSSGCNNALDGYFNYLYNGTFFSYDKRFIDLSELYFCDKGLNPFIENCGEFNPCNCSTTPLKNDCSNQLNFVYSCFGSTTAL